jgi:hypothetical protein
MRPLWITTDGGPTMNEEGRGPFPTNQESISGEENSGKQLLIFLSQMQFRLNILDETRREMNVYLAKDFNVFKYILPDENKISEIFSDFLNPEGDHGQGTLFLEEFFKIMERREDVAMWRGSKVSVIREYATDAISNSQRRIDILVKFSSSPFLLGIENKPSAMDQPAQLADYARHLNKRSDGKFLLVYLSGNGSEPSKESISSKELDSLKNENRFLTLSYRNQLVKWLGSCKQRCEAEKIRSFIQDFIEYIETNFSIYDESEELPTT